MSTLWTQFWLWTTFPHRSIVSFRLFYFSLVSPAMRWVVWSFSNGLFVLIHVRGTFCRPVCAIWPFWLLYFQRCSGHGMRIGIWWIRLVDFASWRFLCILISRSLSHLADRSRYDRSIFGLVLERSSTADEKLETSFTMDYHYMCCFCGCLGWIDLLLRCQSHQHTSIPCYTRSVECRFYNDITLALFTITVPSVTMLDFGLLTINNIHQSKRLIEPSNTVTNAPQGHSRKIERHLTRMLLLQVLLIVAFNLPNAVHILFLSITFYQEKTVLERVTDGFIFNIFTSVAFHFVLYLILCSHTQWQYLSSNSPTGVSKTPTRSENSP